MPKRRKPKFLVVYLDRFGRRVKFSKRKKLKTRIYYGRKVFELKPRKDAFRWTRREFQQALNRKRRTLRKPPRPAIRKPRRPIAPKRVVRKPRAKPLEGSRTWVKKVAPYEKFVTTRDPRTRKLITRKILSRTKIIRIEPKQRPKLKYKLVKHDPAAQRSRWVPVHLYEERFRQAVDREGARVEADPIYHSDPGLDVIDYRTKFVWPDPLDLGKHDFKYGFVVLRIWLVTYDKQAELYRVGSYARSYFLGDLNTFNKAWAEAQRLADERITHLQKFDYLEGIGLVAWTGWTPKGNPK